MKKSTFVYIDGFNLYYRIKKTPFKWLNLEKFVEACLRPGEHDIQKIKFFTARVKRDDSDPHKVIRQNTYLRAIETIPNLEIIFGQFKRRTIKGLLCDPNNRKIKKIVTVKRFEEKQSDVNIATDMIADGHQNKHDCVVLISNDTDLVRPLLHIKKNLKKLVVVISPYEQVHNNLKRASHYFKGIKTDSIFKNSQFPSKIKTSRGEIHCPKAWAL